MAKRSDLPDAEYERLMRCAFRAILENAEEYISVMDKDMVCRAVSDSFARLMGREPDELYGYTDSELYAGGTETAATDGEGVHTRRFHVRDGAGEVIGLVGVGSGSAERREPGEQAGVSWEGNELLNNIPVGCGIAHFENGFFYTDMTSEGLFLIPYITPEMIAVTSGAHFIDAVYEPDRQAVVREYERVKELPAETGSVDHRVRGGDGVLHWMNMKFRRAYMRNGVQYYYVIYSDIDSSKRAELELRKMRRMYEAAVQESNLVVWEYDIAHHRIIMAENEFTEYDYRKFGLPKVTENAPQSLIQYIDDAYVDTFLEMYRRIDAGAARADCEVWYKLKPGTEPRCEHISYTTEFDDDGSPVKAYGIGQNITRQKLAQEEYDRMREQLAGNLADVVGSFQLNLSKNLYISGYSCYPGVAEALAKKTADEHFAATADTVVSEDIKQGILKDYTCARLTELFQSGHKELEREYPVKTSRGSVMWVHSTLHMMLNPSTGDVEGITYSKDITKQKRNEAIVRIIVSENCEYVGIIDTAAGTYERHSGTWLTGTETGQRFPYDNIRKTVAAMFMSPEGAKALLEKTELPAVVEALKNAPRFTVPFRCRAEENGVVPMKQISFCWLDVEHREILVTQQDVTAAYEQEQKHAEELRRAMLEAEHANAMKTEFLSNLSHDMRTPLNAVLGYAGFAIQSNDPAERTDYLEKISRAGNLLLTLINDTLDLSKIESGAIALKLAPIGCGEVIGRVLAPIRPEMEKKHIRFTLENSHAVMATINIDALRVQEIFINLLSNAVKFTPDGGEIALVIECVKLEADCVHDRITVRDSGCGMSQEFLPKLFEPFTQERTKENADVGGSGLGLSIVKRLVDLMGGTIEVRSELGKGTEFEVCLDFERVDDGVAVLEDDGVRLETLAGSRVLLCEDNAMNREIAVKLLEMRGMTAECAENGQIGLRLFSSSEPGHFDAVLMDVRMPVMDGMAAAKAIRALDHPDAKSVPIFAMTADAFDDDVQKCLDAGMNGHIAKPIDPKLLYVKLAAAIRDTRRKDPGE